MSANTQIKKEQLEALDIFTRDEIDELVDSHAGYEIDFTFDAESGEYRFIKDSNIDAILSNELSSDTYILGCFNAWFIADIVGLPTDEVEKAQKNESYELLGALMEKHIDEVVREYVRHDGYGPHFASYDGEELECGSYYVFRIN